MTLTVFFEIGTDPSLAQVDVQNRVNLALPQLPQSVQAQGVTVQKKSIDLHDDHRDLLARRPLRRDLHRQLRQHQRARRDQAHPGRQPGVDLRRPRLRDAHLAEARPHGAARHHRDRRAERREGAEPAVRRRPHRRVAHRRPVQQTFPVTTGPHHRARQFDNIILRAANERRGARAGQGHRPRRARREGLLDPHEATRARRPP